MPVGKGSRFTFDQTDLAEVVDRFLEDENIDIERDPGSIGEKSVWMLNTCDPISINTERVDHLAESFHKLYPEVAESFDQWYESFSN